MISFYTAANKFGGTTWEVRLRPSLRILLEADRSNGFVVALRGRKWAKDTILLTYVTEETMEAAVLEAIDRAVVALHDHEEFPFTAEQAEAVKSEVRKSIAAPGPVRERLRETGRL